MCKHTLEKIKDLPASHSPTSNTACLLEDRRRNTKNTEHNICRAKLFNTQ